MDRPIDERWTDEHSDSNIYIFQHRETDCRAHGWFAPLCITLILQTKVQLLKYSIAFLVHDDFLVEKDSFLHRLPADGTLIQAIPTKLTCAMSTEEDHVFKTIHAHWTASLKKQQHKVALYVSLISFSLSLKHTCTNHICMHIHHTHTYKLLSL